MAFDNIVYLISGGVNYYLSGSTKNAYTGSGTPWTAENTTPYRLSLNDGTSIWVPAPAPAVPIFGGGPPFQNGQSLIYRSFANVTEQVGMQMYANSADNAAALLRQLRLILNTTLFSAPCILAIQTGTNTAYYEIYSADVQETSSYLVEGPTTNCAIRATITWTRSFAGGRLSTGETLINAQTYTVADSTVTLPTNLTAFSTGAGDFIYEGGPLNIRVTPTTASSTIGELWAASTFSQAKATINSALAQYPSTPVSRSINFASALTRTGLKLRIIGRVSNTGGGANTGYYAYIRGALAAGGAYLYSTPGLGAFPTIEATGLVDFGEISLDALRAISPLVGSFNVDFHATTYGGRTANLISTETLLYYDFCKITGVGADQSVASSLWLNQFSERSGYACVPQSPSAVTLTSADTPYSLATVLGTLPRYFSGASLWMNWVSANGDTPTASTRAATVTATHGPLYHTLRGNG